MTLKQEIEATIQAYEEACKPENLTYDYCWKGVLKNGICFYAKHKNYKELVKYCKNDLKDFYISKTPLQIYFNLNFTRIKIKEISTILQSHQTRLQYLKNLLNTIENENLQTKN